MSFAEDVAVESSRRGQAGVKDAVRKCWRKGRVVAGDVLRRAAQWADTSVWFALGLAVAGGIGWLAARRGYEAWGETWQGAFIEAAGAVMDLFVFGVIVGVVVVRRDRMREIRSHQELIDDFKKWDSEESRHRIAGAVRRLNGLGRTAIDFVGMEMSAFSFRGHDVVSIAGSKFYGGAWGSLGSREKAVLREVDFSFVDCRDVVFSAFHPFAGLGIKVARHAQFLDCRFEAANLRGATFKGASIEWTREPPEETGHWEETQEGEPLWVPEYHSPFHRADLAGASFEDVVFRNADFRDAENLDKCQFAGATGLEGCMFDSEEDKELVTRMARAEAG